MKTLRLLIPFALLVAPGIFPFFAEGGENPAPSRTVEPCPPADTECFREAFRAADRRLNILYRSLRKKLPEKTRKEIRDDSRMWIRRKEYNCGWQRENADEKNAESAYYECLSGETRSRIEYLQLAFGGEQTHDSIQGTYQDGASGVLVLKNEGDHYRFAIQVVRGPTSHLGELNGTLADFSAAQKHPTKPEEKILPSATYTAGLKNDDPYDDCTIDFYLVSYETVQGRRPSFRISEEGRCTAYHGARAYFDGTFRKTSDEIAAPISSQENEIPEP